MKPVVVTPAAQRDIERIVDWYESKREGLGLEFSDRVQEAIDRIRLNPEGYAPVFKNARKVQLRKFRDYNLWFQIRADNSLVIACLSGRRNPAFAQERVLGKQGTPPTPARPA